jgi:hypothetical protein
MAEANASISRDDWDEGRYSFYREMLSLALQKELESAAFKSVEKLMDAKFGERHMTTEGNSVSTTPPVKRRQTG